MGRTRFWVVAEGADVLSGGGGGAHAPVDGRCLSPVTSASTFSGLESLSAYSGLYHGASKASEYAGHALTVALAVMRGKQEGKWAHPGERRIQKLG